MAINYYQLVTLVEISPKVLNISGLVINAIFFLFLVITLGQPSLLCLKQLLIYMKRILANWDKILQRGIHVKIKKVQKVQIRPSKPDLVERIKLQS